MIKHIAMYFIMNKYYFAIAICTVSATTTTFMLVLMKVARFMTWVRCRVASVLMWPAAVLCPRGWENDGANMSLGGGGGVFGLSLCEYLR